MTWLIVYMLISALPEVTITFKSEKAALELGLPVTFTTSLAHDWSTYNCSKVASGDDSIVCKVTPVACLPDLARHTIRSAPQYDRILFDGEARVPTPVPIRIT